MRDAIEKGKYMADIISGKSRFNGDRNAPVKKVISINREMAASTEDNEDVLDEAAVKRKYEKQETAISDCGSGSFVFS